MLIARELRKYQSEQSALCFSTSFNLDTLAGGFPGRQQTAPAARQHRFRASRQPPRGLLQQQSRQVAQTAPLTPRALQQGISHLLGDGDGDPSGRRGIGHGLQEHRVKAGSPAGAVDGPKSLMAPPRLAIPLQGEFTSPRGGFNGFPSHKLVIGTKTKAAGISSHGICPERRGLWPCPPHLEHRRQATLYLQQPLQQLERRMGPLGAWCLVPNPLHLGPHTPATPPNGDQCIC